MSDFEKKFADEDSYITLSGVEGYSKFSISYNGITKTFSIQPHQRYIWSFDFEKEQIEVCRYFSPLGKPMGIEIVKADK